MFYNITLWNNNDEKNTLNQNMMPFQTVKISRSVMFYTTQKPSSIYSSKINSNKFLGILFSVLASNVRRKCRKIELVWFLSKNQFLVSIITTGRWNSFCCFLLTLVFRYIRYDRWFFFFVFLLFVWKFDRWLPRLFVFSFSIPRNVSATRGRNVTRNGVRR